MLVYQCVNLPEGSAFAAMTVIRKKKYKKWSLYAGYNADYLLTRNGEKYLKKIKKNMKKIYLLNFKKKQVNLFKKKFRKCKFIDQKKSLKHY